MTEAEQRLWKAISQIPGGYCYGGAYSTQLCFPLKWGGELRFLRGDDGPDIIEVDHYDGAVPPCITGHAVPTGGKK